LTTLGTSDVSTPRNVTGTFGIFSCRSGSAGGADGAGGLGGEGCANPAIGRRAATAMITTDFVFIVLFCKCSGKLLTGNRNEKDLLAWIGNAKRCACGSIVPLQRLMRLITDTAHRLLRTVPFSDIPKRYFAVNLRTARKLRWHSNLAFAMTSRCTC